MRGSSEQGSDVAAAGPQLVIWGTDVVVSQCKEKFIRFISRYIDEAVDEDEQFDGMDVREPYYIQRLDEVRRMLGLGLLSLSFLGDFFFWRGLKIFVYHYMHGEI